jgi:16S rRNA (guanine527-N7)-methyltransferase
VSGPVRVRGPEEFARTFSVSRETLDRLDLYANELARWQKAVNLVAPATLSEVWHRHFADSAQLLALAPADARRWLDLGSGAGFPGLVLAILLAGRGGTARVTLVESDTRKAAFLREVARQTGAPVDILSIRIEALPTQASLQAVDVVTARALAPLPRLLELAVPVFGANTVGLFLKGREAAAEVAQAQAAGLTEYAIALAPSVTDREGRIAVVRRVGATTKEGNP